MNVLHPMCGGRHLLALTLICFVGSSVATSSTAPWWESDIWHDPNRPFLFYAEKAKKTPAPKKENPVATPQQVPQAAPAVTADPDDFSAFVTIESLKAEREKRLSVAIMNPTEENMASYQAINAHMLSLSARFAEAWQFARLTNPQYDFTSSHPSAAFAVSAMAEERTAARASLLDGLREDVGLIFIGDPSSKMTDIAAGPVAAFARSHRLQVLAIATDPALSAPAEGRTIPGFSAFEQVLPDRGQSARWGIRMLPAVLLIPSPEAMHSRPEFRRMAGALSGYDGAILGTGALSGEEIARRIALILGPASSMTGEPAFSPTLPATAGINSSAPTQTPNSP